MEKEQPKENGFIGIDALPGKEYGVDQVLNKVLDATFMYPTGGDIVMQVAMSILQKQPFLVRTYYPPLLWILRTHTS